jgi:hypothetical protein
MPRVRPIPLAIALAFAAGPAIAGDLPAGRAEEPRFVAVCDRYGSGFFTIPGSTSCLAIGGQVEIDTTWQQPTDRSSEVLTTTSIGHFAVDHRTATDYGDLRTFVRIELARPRAGTPFIEYAFVKFGNVEAGRTDSVFNFYAGDLNIGTIRGANLTVNSFKATAQLTDSLSIVAALEAGAEGRGSIREPRIDELLGIPRGAAGSRIPDVVGALIYTKGWGTLQLNGALHQLRSTDPRVDDAFGYAAQAGANLIFGRDLVWLEAAWASGDLEYLGFTGGARVGDLAISTPDAVVVDDRLSRSSGYALTAAYQHIWSDTINQSLYGSYSRISNGARLDPARVSQTEGFTELRLGGNLAWNPVKDLIVTGEVIWARLTPDVPTPSFVQPDLLRSSASNWQATLQVKRTF